MNDILRTNTKRIALYLRVSTKEQTEKYGLDLQRDAILAMIKSRSNSDHAFVFAGEQHVYVDDLSGTIPLVERPSFVRLMEDIKHAPEGAKPFDAVAVYKIDRFARKLSILLDAISFFEHSQIEFISINESIDTSSAFGRAMLSIIGVIAELERDTIKARTTDGRVAAIQKGVHMGTGAPLGYAKDDSKRLVLLDDEVTVVQLIFDLYVQQRKSVYEIADYLSEKKYLTPEASSIKFEKHSKKARSSSPYKWHSENIRRILLNELYTGRAYYGKTKNGKKVPKNEWQLFQVPHIISDLTYQKALDIAASSKHGNKPARSNHQYLLTGLLRCDTCKNEHHLKHFVGLPQTVKSSGQKVYYYQCKGKSHEYKKNPCMTLPIGADAIEDYIVSLCKNILSNPLHTYKYQQSLESTRLKTKHLKREEEQLLKLIEAAPDRRKRLSFQHVEGLLDEKALKKEIGVVFESEKKNRAKLSEVQAQISQCSLDEGYERTFKFFDKNYSQMLSNFEKNRAEAYYLIHALIDQVIVYSKPVEDVGRVAGKKRDGQMVASRIHVKFRLPQDMLNEMGAQTKEKAPLVGASSSQKDILGAR